MRPMGEITQDLEDLITEMVDQHDLQWGEILNLIFGYLLIHFPNARETYEDDSHPVFYYGCPNEEFGYEED
jgi:hypothetical protein